MRVSDQEALRKWLALPGRALALQRALPAEPTPLSALSAKCVKYVCCMTACGFTDAELDVLFRFLHEEGIVHYEGTHVHVPPQA